MGPSSMSPSLRCVMDLVRRDEEPRQEGRAETRRERHVGGIPARGHQDASDPRHVVTGVEGIPPAAQVGFKPGAEIHRIIQR
jgi:hypothetical protein